MCGTSDETQTKMEMLMTSVDFSYQNLRGRNFRGQDLQGALFTGADLRGARFQNADLTGADFSRARMGKTVFGRITTVLVMLFIVLSAIFLGEFFIIISKQPIGSVLRIFYETGTEDYRRVSLLWIFACTSGMIGILLLFLKRSGFSRLFRATGLVTAVAFAGLVLTFILAGPEAGAKTFALYGFRPGGIVFIFPFDFALSFGFLVAVTFLGALIFPRAGFLYQPGVITGAITGMLALIVSMGFGFPAIVAVIVALAFPPVLSEAKVMASAIALAVVLAGIGFGGGVGIIYIMPFLPALYVSKRIRQEDPLFARLRQSGLRIASLGGTNFHGSYLADAQFRMANLKHARFAGPKTLAHADFRNAKNSELAYTKGMLLEDTRVRRLLVTGEGEGQSYAELNLKGAFLAGAGLSGADFTRADLSDADLSGADLRNALLVKSRLIGADLTGARLTKAHIDNWNIDGTTRLQDIDCEYVFS
uniref:Uncharacterized protein YjbI, contains pentapeptide repeats n=1 Tax=Candidatus Kentrum sp. DK TaxID=2126562 RepID=A0A450T3H8_9GAMM|nr:MAG: Uncharacterized protein YjbI, contains pentapeptide repeats [Candidatus Kentron sp. DK]